MNDRYGRTASPAGKKGIRSSAALALAAGLVLACWGSTAQALGEPIPGIDIVVKCLGCRPPVHGISAPTGSDGTYEFTGLAAGEYDLSIAGRRVQAISVGANRSIGGVLSRQAGGMASITINGQAAALGPAAAIVTSRDNPAGRDKTRGKAGIGGVDDPSADGNQRVAAEDDISALGSVSTTRGRVEKPGAPDGDKTSDKKTSGEGRKNDDDRFGKFGNDMNAGPAMNPAMGGFMGASPVMGPIGPGAGGSGGAMGPRR